MKDKTILETGKYIAALERKVRNLQSELETLRDRHWAEKDDFMKELKILFRKYNLHR